jgi:NAD(P)-dependent dehydrogenase (short-subunit alcohol dehydrogenase family)
LPHAANIVLLPPTLAESVKAALTAAVAKFGGIHIVLNSAGISSPCRVLNNKGAVHSMEHFDKVIRINLHGTFNVIRLALPIIAKQVRRSSPNVIWLSNCLGNSSFFSPANF